MHSEDAKLFLFPKKDVDSRLYADSHKQATNGPSTYVLKS